MGRALRPGIKGLGRLMMKRRINTKRAADINPESNGDTNQEATATTKK